MKKPNFKRPVLNKILTLLVILSLLIAMFMLTNPDNVSLAVLLIPFLLTGYGVYLLTSLVLMLRGSSKATGALAKLVPMSAAFLVVALLLLASLGQLTLRDGLLVTGFTLFFLAYVLRADFLK